MTDSTANHGLLLMGPGGEVGRYNFWAFEASVPNALKPHLRVSYVYEASPAERFGIREGGVLLHVLGTGKANAERK